MSSSEIRPDDPSSIRAMFERLAPDYDRLNLLLTLGLVRGWRRALVRAADLRPGDRVLDVGTGTGRTLDAVGRAVGERGRAIGVDFTPAMLSRANGALVLGDALRLPFREGEFDAALSALVLRDVADQRGFLAEMARVTRQGGRVAILEVGRPARQPFRLGFDLWFRGVTPALGAVFGHRDAYRFLVRSARFLPAAEELRRLMGDAGLTRVRAQDLALGVAQVWSGEVLAP